MPKEKGNRIARVSADYKDINGLAEEFCKAIRRFGLTVVEDPGCEGTDQYGFVISDEPLSQTALEEVCEMF